MKRKILIPLLLGIVTLSSCAEIPPPQGEAAARSIMVSSQEDWFWQGQSYTAFAWEEESQSGGGIGPKEGSSQGAIAFEGTQVQGISRAQGTWFACEKKEGDCGGDGAQLLYWDTEEQEQKRIADLCSCEGARYLVAGDWVFANQVCDSLVNFSGLYGHGISRRRSFYFPGQVLGLGLRQGEPHALMLEEEGAKLYRIRLEEELPQMEELASWDSLPRSDGRLLESDCFFYDGAAVSFLEGEGLCLWEDGREARFVDAPLSCAAPSENCLFFADASAVYCADMKLKQVEKLQGYRAEQAEFVLFPLEKDRLVFRASHCYYVDVLLWRWEMEYTLVWRKEEGDCRILSSQGHLVELTADQIPLFHEATAEGK